MAADNHRLAFRPLLAGTMISSSEVRRAGTIGCFATSGGGDRWALTAAHVLSPSRAPFVVVGQPNYAFPAQHISRPHTPVRYAPTGTDIAAFRIRDDIPVMNATLELGVWGLVQAPATGMVVTKAGATTGVTRGIIAAVGPGGFEVVPVPGMPSGYAAFGQGDSGAAWMSVQTGALLGIHVAQGLPASSLAVTLAPVLASLGLSGTIGA